MDGAYSGVTSQNEAVTFEVQSGGASMTKFRINSVNQSCQPPNLVSIYGALDLGTTVVPIAADGGFTWSFAGPGTVSGIAAQFTIAVNGRFTGSSASGTAKFDLAFTVSGIAITCSSGTVTWTAART